MARKNHLRYIELRPINWRTSARDLTAGRSYWLHSLDLSSPLADLFQNLHKNSLQRRIRKAEREHLEYERGNSDELLDEFCRLLLLTRRRHHLLPQPRSWFRNLARNMKPHFDIRVARKERKAIAAIVTLRHRRAVVYKYGCSDEQYHYLAGMPFLFWKLIEESKTEGAEQLDFGRTDLDNEGLIRFKDQFGTVRTQITYLRYPQATKEASDIPSRFSCARPAILRSCRESSAGGLVGCCTGTWVRAYPTLTVIVRGPSDNLSNYYRCCC